MGVRPLPWTTAVSRLVTQEEERGSKGGAEEEEAGGGDRLQHIR